MRDIYRLKAFDKHGQAQVGADVLIDEVDVRKLQAMFGAMSMVGILAEDAKITVEKQEEE